MPIQEYVKSGNLWVPYDWIVDQTPVLGGRESLVAGVHKPNAPGNVGPYTVTNWTDSNPATGAYHIVIGTAGTYTGIRFWGQIRVTVAGVIFRECQFMGPDPLLAPSNDQGFFKCFAGSHNSNDQKPFEVWDSLFDPAPWITERGRTSLCAVSMAFHGYNFKCYRSEMRNIQDPIGWIGANGAGGGTTVADQETLSQQNWIHKGYYVNNYYGPSDGQVHSDGIQTNYGKNFTSNGDYIGGTRDMTGFWTWPVSGAHPFTGPGYNSGDDFYGAGIMLKQEVSNDATHLIENVTIQNGWIEGGSQGINHASNTNAPNTWGSLTVENMTFIPRTGTGSGSWGTTYKGTNGPDSPTVVQSSGPGAYIIRANTMTSTYTGNIIEGAGAVPITNGGA